MGGDPMAGGMGMPPQAQGGEAPQPKVAEGDNMGSGIEGSQRVPAQKQMDRMKERMDKSKVPD